MNMNNDMKSNVFSDETDIFNSGTLGNNQTSNYNPANNSSSNVGSSNNKVVDTQNSAVFNNQVMNGQSGNAENTNHMPNSTATNVANNSANQGDNVFPNNSVAKATQNLVSSNQQVKSQNVFFQETNGKPVNQSNQNMGNNIRPNNSSVSGINQSSGVNQNTNNNQIPVNNDLEMPKLNNDETIGMMRKDTQKSPIAMLILFVVLILSVFLVPQITPYFSDILKIFNIDDNSSIYDDNRKDNISDDNNTKQDQNNNNNNSNEAKTTYYDLKAETEITFGNLKISNFIKTTEDNNFYLSYKILNNGDTSYSFRDHKIYFDFYNGSKTYLGRIMIDTDTLASKGEITLKSIISETEYTSATSLEVLERTAADYQSVTLKNNKLACTNNNHSIIYTFNNDNLVRLDDTFNYNFTVNDDIYAKYSLDTQNTVNELNRLTGVSAGFVNRETGFTKTVRIDYNATEEDFTKYDRLYYLKNEKASTINYELESIGYKCD